MVSLFLLLPAPKNSAVAVGLKVCAWLQVSCPAQVGAVVLILSGTATWLYETGALFFEVSTAMPRQFGHLWVGIQMLGHPGKKACGCLGGCSSIPVHRQDQHA